MAERKVVAVEGSLGPVAEALKAEGFTVRPVEAGNLGAVDAVVVTGMDTNLMGMQTAQLRAPVVVASGRDPAAVVAEVRQRMVPNQQMSRHGDGLGQGTGPGEHRTGR